MMHRLRTVFDVMVSSTVQPVLQRGPGFDPDYLIITWRAC